MDFIVDFLKYLEERHPVWGRRIATLLLTVVGVAVFGTALHFANLYVFQPLWQLALIVADAWRTHSLGAVLSERAWAALLTAALFGAFYIGIVRVWAWNANRRLNRVRGRLRRYFDGKEKKLDEIQRSLLEQNEQVRQEARANYDEYLTYQDHLSKQHAENKRLMRALVDQFDAAMAKIQKEADKVSSPAGSPALQQPEGTEEERAAP